MIDQTRTTFAAVSRIEDLSPGEFTAGVNPEWTIGGKPNGGYLLAMLGRAAVRSGAQATQLAGIRIDAPE